MPKKVLGIGFLFKLFKRNSSQEKREHAKQPRPKKADPSDSGVPHEYRRSRQFSVISPLSPPKRLTVLIATMEYEIEDWGIKVKIGGLGVMSSLMGKHLKHQDIIWVVPW